MRYNDEQKADALKLVDEIGAKKASEQLSISYPTILDWRKKREATPIPASIEEVPSEPPTISVSNDEILALETQVQLLQQENAQLKEQLARQAKAISALSPIDELA